MSTREVSSDTETWHFEAVWSLALWFSTSPQRSRNVLAYSGSNTSARTVRLTVVDNTCSDSAICVFSHRWLCYWYFYCENTVSQSPRNAKTHAGRNTDVSSTRSVLKNLRRLDTDTYAYCILLAILLMHPGAKDCLGAKSEKLWNFLYDAGVMRWT